jgi:hypothetical protein
MAHNKSRANMQMTDTTEGAAAEEAKGQQYKPSILNTITLSLLLAVIAALIALTE